MIKYSAFGGAFQTCILPVIYITWRDSICFLLNLRLFLHQVNQSTHKVSWAARRGPTYTTDTLVQISKPLQPLCIPVCVTTLIPTPGCIPLVDYSEKNGIIEPTDPLTVTLTICRHSSILLWRCIPSQETRRWREQPVLYLVCSQSAGTTTRTR